MEDFGALGFAVLSLVLDLGDQAGLFHSSERVLTGIGTKPKLMMLVALFAGHGWLASSGVLQACRFAYRGARTWHQNWMPQFFAMVVAVTMTLFQLI